MSSHPSPSVSPASSRAGHVSRRPSRRDLASFLLVVAGVAFVAYPALRPYSPETGLAGARAFASGRWTVAHLCAVAGFVVLSQVLVRLDLRNTPARGRRGAQVVALGGTLVLPYYGAEVFGVGAVGREALRLDRPDLVGPAVGAIRYGAPAAVLFVVGLVALAIGGLLLGAALWRAGARWAGILLAAGLVLFLPQFFLPAALRIAHGVVLGVGLALLARHVSTGRARLRA